MRELGEQLNYEGWLGVDFLVDSDTGDAWLIDANPRLPLGYQNAKLSGARLAEGYVAGVTGKGGVSRGYREGVRTRSLVGHLYWLFASLFHLRGNPLEVIRTYRRDRRGSSPELFDRHDLVPILLFPWIILTIQFKRGRSIMEKFLHGAVFTDETFLKMGLEHGSGHRGQPAFPAGTRQPRGARRPHGRDSAQGEVSLTSWFRRRKHRPVRRACQVVPADS